ncbi:RHS repeat protein, partial [Escherichia coli]|nr:RHS repeat protein [Escherichia coli]
SVVFPPVLVQMLDRLESEILADRVSEESRRWLASCGLTVEQMQNQMDPVYTPARKIHLYHCDHRGLPLALISTEGATAWCAEYDESSLSGCRGSSMMRSPACITTATAIMTRCRGDISLRIRLG